MTHGSVLITKTTAVERFRGIAPKQVSCACAEANRAPACKTAIPNFSNVVHLPPTLDMADMAPLPAHPPQMEDDTDEELTDEQVRELLTEAAERMRANPSQSATDAPFKLPKLDPGHIADTYSTTHGAITKLDGSKLLPQRDQALANGIRKIEDPVQLKKQKQEVSCHAYIVLARDDNYPILY